MSVTSAPRELGSTIEKKIRHGPAPSIRALSSRAIGIEEKNWRMKKTPKAPAAPGRMTDHRVSSRFSSFKIKKFGIMKMKPGMNKVAMIMPKINFLNGNSIRARAYPAIEEMITTMNACTDAAISEFSAQSSTGEESSVKNRVRKACRVGSWGSTVGGMARDSTLDLSAVSMVQTSGRMMIRLNTISNSQKNGLRRRAGRELRFAAAGRLLAGSGSGQRRGNGGHSFSLRT